MACVQHEHDDAFCPSCKDRARVEELEEQIDEYYGPMVAAHHANEHPVVGCKLPACIEAKQWRQMKIRTALAKKGGSE